MFKNMMNGQGSIQIHYNGQHHWVCSSYDHINTQVVLYDSLCQTKTTMELDTQLAQIYGSDSMQFRFESRLRILNFLMQNFLRNILYNEFEFANFLT